MTIAIRDDGDGGVLIALKAVPGAKRDEVAGLLGERIKVRVSAPPEGGRANEAICRVIAEALGVRVQQVDIVSGHISPEKVVRVGGIDAEAVRSALGL